MPCKRSVYTIRYDYKNNQVDALTFDSIVKHLHGCVAIAPCDSAYGLHLLIQQTRATPQGHAAWLVMLVAHQLRILIREPAPDTRASGSVGLIPQQRTRDLR